MYETMPAVTGLNRVEGFEPKELMREIGDEQNKQLYLDVQFRKLWFRLKYATGKIHKKIVQLTEQFAIVEARIYLDKNDPEEDYIANAFARRYVSSDSEFGAKYLELAETAAVGRALADAGFGSQFADTDGEADPVQVDAGIPIAEPPAAIAAEAGQPDEPAAGMPKVTSENGIAFQAAPAPAPAAAAAVPTQPAKPAYTSKMDVAEILSMMTLEEAKSLKVTIGMNKGKTLGTIAVESPKDLKWYTGSYRGPDNILKAAATLLMNSALQEAS